jgi:ATPase subunit of ABC transporter with duplicated ATPase domains
MISFSNINKQYGKQLIFVDASFQLNPGEKVGLVGPNGAGKTTLFRMVVGEETPDEGAVSVPKKLTIGYFRQDVEEMQGRSVLDEAIAGSGRVGDLHHELEALQREMSDPDKADDMDRILERFLPKPTMQLRARNRCCTGDLETYNSAGGAANRLGLDICPTTRGHFE